MELTVVGPQPEPRPKWRLMCRLRCGLRGRCRFYAGEINFRRSPGAFTRGKVRIIALESSHAGPQAIREQADEGVVILQSVIVTLAFDGYPVLGSSQLILQAAENFHSTSIGDSFPRPPEDGQVRHRAAGWPQFYLRE